MMVILAFNSHLKEFKLCSIILLTDKSGTIYDEMYYKIKSLVTWIPEFITVDFEIANIIAIEKHFPTVRIVPCFFHFSDNVASSKFFWPREERYCKEDEGFNFKFKDIQVYSL